MKINILFAILSYAILNTVTAQRWSSGRPDGHAPISVMGDHTHSPKDWMVSYRFSHMSMSGLRDGTADLSNDEVRKSYTMVPNNMEMSMHMFSMMYALSDKLTLMLMGNYTQLDMQMTNGFMDFESKSAGLGDLKISGMWKSYDFNRQRLHFNIGLSIPTGSIDQTGVTPMSAPNSTQLAYPMQLGSGTLDFMPGITYLGQNKDLSWGAQGMATIRLGDNKRNYSFGDQVAALGWMAYRTSKWLSFSGKLKASTTGSISGKDPDYANVYMAPTFQSSNFGGKFVISGVGFNVYAPNGALKNVRFGLEYEIPVYQKLNGPQLKVKNQGTVGIQYSW